MKLRFEQLFNIALTTSYYTDNKTHEDLIIEPTSYCQKQMSRFKILSKKTFDGMVLLYECNPLTNDATAFNPIKKEEIFTFKVKVKNADFWFYADVQDWESGKIYLFRNPTYATTGDINIVTGALTSPIHYRPMEFKYDVALETVEGLLEIRNSNGTLIKTLVIRAKTATEAAGVKEQYLINLENYNDGTYTLRHITTSGNVDEQVYCSADYSSDTLAIIEITYKGDVAWTGVIPFQKYIINIASRSTDWFFDVHIRQKAMPVALASQLSLKHLPIPPEVVKMFTVNDGPYDATGFVQFKSSVKLSYSHKPMHLQLLKTGSIIPIMDPLPLPSPIDVQKDALNNLFTKVIVNV